MVGGVGVREVKKEDNFDGVHNFERRNWRENFFQNRDTNGRAKLKNFTAAKREQFFQNNFQFRKLFFEGRRYSGIFAIFIAHVG